MLFSCPVTPEPNQVCQRSARNTVYTQWLQPGIKLPLEKELGTSDKDGTNMAAPRATGLVRLEHINRSLSSGCHLKARAKNLVSYSVLSRDRALGTPLSSPWGSHTGY